MVVTQAVSYDRLFGASMDIQELLDSLTAKSDEPLISDTADFIAFLSTEAVTHSADPFSRLVTAALRAGSQANATIAGHQSAIRRLFPSTPADAVTAFCVSESKGPHPRFINTQLGETGGQLHITGEKMWGTMAPAASLLYVAASTGVVDGQNQLAMVGVDTGSPGITEIPLPPERQAGAVPICDLTFEQTPVYGNHVFPGDAYTTYIKPFRLIEDVFSTVAMQIGLFRLGSGTGLSHDLREDLIGLIMQGHAVAASNMDSSGALLLITSYLRASQEHWAKMRETWHQADPSIGPHWHADGKILTVAAKARATRRETAWRNLGENLDS